MLQNITLLDLVFILVYFSILFTLGFYFSRKEKSSTDYFLAGRQVGWVAIGASLFASNISSEHFIGLAGSGASRGLAVGHFEWLASFILLILGWVFVPFYLKSGVFTMPEFLERRYNKSSRLYLTSVSIIAYILTKISVTLFAGGLLLHEILGWDIATSAIVMVIIAGIYTIAGGLEAIVHIDVLQSSVLILGAALLTFFGLHEIGGWTALQAKVPGDFFSMFKPVTDPDFPWTGIIFGAPILGIWYWCTDQYIVQRVLGGKSIDHAQSGALLAGFLKILPVFILVFPGVIAYVYFENPAIGDKAYPLLVASQLLPSGVKGIVIASLLAALISSLASCFNSSSTLFTMDFYREFRPDSSEKELVLVGRLATTVMVILGILWVPFIKFISSQVYIYLQSVQAYISPPIAAVFVLGILWKRVNGAGAIWALVAGAILGAFRLVVELLYKAGSVENEWLQWIARVNFLHFAIFLFLTSAGILVLVSLLTLPPGETKVTGLTFATAQAGVPGVNSMPETGHSNRKKINLIFSVLLVIFLIGLYIRFF